MANQTVPVEAVAHLREGLENRLGTILRTAQLLANHQRVHAALSEWAAVDPAFTEMLGRACTDWRDPCDAEGDGETITELLRVACVELASLVGDSDAMLEQACGTKVGAER